MGRYAVQVENVIKEYRIGQAQQSYSTLRDVLTESLMTPVRRVRNLMRGEAYGAADLSETIRALDDISFDVGHGEVVGIIGHNGAGKSTLLKILSRITEPTYGLVRLHGRIGALLEVGTGFHNELTGRENVFLNGAILGMSRVEIERKFDEIVDFSGVEKFVDTPVKFYSSGMRLRLGFAVAAHLEPEILIVDEVLAVGDAEFQKKCLGKMSDVAGEGRTVLFVSHNMGAVTTLCTRGILLKQGKIVMQGDTDAVIAHYLSGEIEKEGEISWLPDGYAGNGVNDFALLSVRVLTDDYTVSTSLDVRKGFKVELKYRVDQPLSTALRVGFVLTNRMGVVVFVSYDIDSYEIEADYRQPGVYTGICTVPGDLLAPGDYFLTINAGIPRQRNLLRLENALAIRVIDTGGVDSRDKGGRAGIIQPRLQWDVHREEDSVIC